MVLLFAVGEECPYYSTGYTTAKLTIRLDTQTAEIEGPEGTKYVKVTGDSWAQYDRNVSTNTVEQ